MNWKFWQKEQTTKEPSHTKKIKSPRPKDIPDRVGRYLVTQLKENPDWVWNLKAALRPKGEEKDVFEIRIFDPEQAAGKGISINSFDTLEKYPEMILFAGWYKKNSDSLKIERTLKKVA